MPPVDRRNPIRAASSESSLSLMEFMREFPDDETCLRHIWRERFAPVKTTNVLLAHLLYQPTLEDALREVQRVPRAGWSILMMADAQGNLACIEVSPREVALDRKRGYVARDNAYRTPQLFRAWALDNPDLQGRYEKANALLAQGAGKIDAGYIQHMYDDTRKGIGRGVTLDMLIFDVTARQAYISRGPLYGVDWHRYAFSKPS